MKSGNHKTHQNGDEPQAPRKLVTALKESSPPCVFVPSTVDEAVLAAARRHLSQSRQRRFGFSVSWLKWPALATASVVLVGLVFFSAQRGSDQQLVREDLNHDGRVDILDAFQLAREAQAGSAVPAQRDLNGDGVVDQRDAEIIAAHAVKLEKGGRS